MSIGRTKNLRTSRDSVCFSNLNWIYSQLPSMKQMLVVSATYSQQNLTTLHRYMVDPMLIRPEDATRPLIGVKQLVSLISEECKNPSLKHIGEEKKLVQLLSHVPFTQCVIFSNYQLRPDVISENLAQTNFGSVFLSGAQEQSARLASLESFKRGQVRILVTTDLAARGIDAANVDLVINLEVPHDAATYLHRMGRAGRYGTRGLVITIVSLESLVKFHSLMADINLDHQFNVGLLPDDLAGADKNWLHRVEVLQNLAGEKQVVLAKRGRNVADKKVENENVEEEGETGVSESDGEAKEGVEVEKGETEETSAKILGKVNEKRNRTVENREESVKELDAIGDEAKEFEEKTHVNADENRKPQPDKTCVKEVEAENVKNIEILQEKTKLHKNKNKSPKAKKLTENGTNSNNPSDEKCDDIVETEDANNIQEKSLDETISLSDSASKLESVDFELINEFINQNPTEMRHSEDCPPNSTSVPEISPNDDHLIRNMKACLDNDLTQMTRLMKELDHIDADALSDWILNKHNNVAALFRSQDPSVEDVKDGITTVDEVSNTRDTITIEGEPVRSHGREIQSYDSLGMFSPCQTTLDKFDIEAHSTMTNILKPPDEPKKKNRKNKKSNKENKNILNTPTKTCKNGAERTPDRFTRTAPKNDPLRDDLNATGDAFYSPNKGFDDTPNKNTLNKSRDERSARKASKLPQRDLVVYDEIDIFSPAANNLDEYEIDYIEQNVIEPDSSVRRTSSEDSLYHNDSLDIKLRKKLKAGNRRQRNQKRLPRQSDQNTTGVNGCNGKVNGDGDDTPMLKAHGNTKDGQQLFRNSRDTKKAPSRKLSHDDTDFQISWEDNDRSQKDRKESSRHAGSQSQSETRSKSSAQNGIGKHSKKTNRVDHSETATNSINPAYEANFSKLDLSAYNDESAVFLPYSSSEEDDSESGTNEGNPNAVDTAVFNESSLNSSCIDLICDDLDEQYYAMYRDTEQTPDRLNFKGWIKDMELYNVSTNVNVSDDDGLDDSYNILKTPTPVKHRQQNDRFYNHKNPAQLIEQSVGRRKVDGKVLRNPLLRTALVNKQNQVNLWNQENHGATYVPLDHPFESNFSNSFNFETDFSNAPQWVKKTHHKHRGQMHVRALPHESSAVRGVSTSHHDQYYADCESKRIASSEHHLYASSPCKARKHCNKASSNCYDYSTHTACPVASRGSKCNLSTSSFGHSQFDPNKMSRKALQESRNDSKCSPNEFLGADGDTVNATFGDFGDYTYSKLNELEDYDGSEIHEDLTEGYCNHHLLVGEETDDDNEDFSEKDTDDLSDEDEENPIDDVGESRVSTSRSGQPKYRASSNCGSANSSSQSGSPHQSGTPVQSGDSSYKSVSLESYSVIDNASVDVSWQSANSQVGINPGSSGNSRKHDPPRTREASSRKGRPKIGASGGCGRNEGSKIRASGGCGRNGSNSVDSKRGPIVHSRKSNFNPYDAAMPGAWQSVPIEEFESRFNADESVYFSEEAVEKAPNARDRRCGEQRRMCGRGEMDSRARAFDDRDLIGNVSSKHGRAELQHKGDFGRSRVQCRGKHTARNINSQKQRRRRRVESFGNETFDLEALCLDDNRPCENVQKGGLRETNAHRNHRSCPNRRFKNDATTRFHGNSTSSTRTYSLYSSSEDSRESYDEDASHYENGLVHSEQACPYENVLRAHPAYYPGLDVGRMRRGMDRQRAFMEGYVSQLSLYMNVARNVANTPHFNF